jgi:glutathione peroxidase
VNGQDTDPIFALLKEAAPADSGPDITWNFNKFLVSADRSTVTRYMPKTLPAEMVPQIEEMLSEASA